MCECYKVGGPFIAEDPDCPVHGTDARRRDEAHDERMAELEARVASLEKVADNLLLTVNHLTNAINSLSASRGGWFFR